VLENLATKIEQGYNNAKMSQDSVPVQTSGKQGEASSSEQEVMMMNTDNGLLDRTLLGQGAEGVSLMMI